MVFLLARVKHVLVSQDGAITSRHGPIVLCVPGAWGGCYSSAMSPEISERNSDRPLLRVYRNSLIGTSNP